MKKTLMALLMAVLLLACWTAVHAEASYVDVDNGTNVTVSGDFSAQIEVARGGHASEGGLTFYNADGNAFYFKVRWLDGNRVDFYGSKDVGGAWSGFLIAEEYDASKKDCFVSLDDGWDATADTSVILTVTVEGSIATVTMTGNNTGMSGTLHFDLTKSSFLGGYNEDVPAILTGGALQYTGACEALSMTLDSETYDAIFGPKDPVKPAYVWYPNNTVNVAGVSLSDLGLGSNWRNVLPVDLTQNGTKTYTLLAADTFVIGSAAVTVADGAVTVDLKTYYGEIYINEASVAWFASLADVDVAAPGKYAVGEAVSIAEEIGADVGILYLNAKATYRQPYNVQGAYLPRYWRNTAERVAYREQLKSLLSAVPAESAEWVEVPVDSRIAVKGDFKAKVVVTRDNGVLDGGLTFYHNEASGYSYGMKVRWNEDKRADFYGIKDIAGAWGGFLIAEEYQEWMKDCYVSVDEGWDASADTKMTLTISVEGTMATVTMTGDVTGKSGTIHFDLTKSPWLDWEEKELEPQVLTEGLLFCNGSGTPLQLFIDVDTYNAQ